MPNLGLNIDHIATLRQARYSGWKRGLAPEPSLLEAARLGELAGARSITVHLREDRRHIQDADMKVLRKGITTRLNMEMAATSDMVKNALIYKPDEVCLVPEKREEVTTEGGLDVLADEARIHEVVSQLQRAKIAVSLFIDPEMPQVAAAARIGARMVELHTGAYANAMTEKARAQQISRHAKAAQQAHLLKLVVNAGHGLHYCNLREYLDEVPHLHTLNIGHAIISRALFVGISDAVHEIVALLHKPSSMSFPHSD